MGGRSTTPREQLPAETGSRAVGDRGDAYRLRVDRLPAMVGFARTDLRRWLTSRCLPPEVVNDVTLASSEAVANAVEHAQQPSRELVEIQCSRYRNELTVSVRDFGSWADHSRSDLGGRGLLLIRQLVDFFAVERGDQGTRITMQWFV